MHRKAFNGMCLAIIKADKASGEITLYAKSKGLKASIVEVISK